MKLSLSLRLLNSVAVLPLLILFGCANQPCHPYAVPTEAPPQAAASATATVPLVRGVAEKTKSAAKTVWVFKPNQSKQCEKDSGVALDAMQKELGDIIVLKSLAQHDGKMRTQNCGQVTGKINSYEISEKDLIKAEALGFKRMNKK